MSNAVSGACGSNPRAKLGIVSVELRIARLPRHPKAFAYRYSLRRKVSAVLPIICNVREHEHTAGAQHS
jgi:hypothetical protein